MSRRPTYGAMARAMAPLQSSSYVAGSINNFRRVSGLNPMGSNADWHYRTQGDFLRMMELARSFDRNDPIVGMGLNRLVDNCIQGGFTPDPNTGSREADEYLKSRWKEWAGNPNECHRARRYNFHQIERLTLRSIVVDGDILHLPLKGGQLQEIEAHRLRTPSNTKRNVVHGVMMDESSGAAQEYWITKKDVGFYPVQKVADIQPISAWDGDNPAAFHVYFPKRFSQSRGVTALAPTVDYIGMNDDANWATMVARKVQASFAIIRNMAPGASIDDAGALGSQDSKTEYDGTVTTIEDVMPGMEYIGAAGETISGFSPDVPSQNFMEHSMFVLGVTAANLDIPLMMLLLDPSKTNFSGWRGAVDEARKAFKRIQRQLIDQFHTHVWNWKVRQWLDESPILSRAAGMPEVDIYRHRWNCPAWKYIEPHKDAQADALIIREALTSRRRIYQERGMDWDEVAPEIVADNALIITTALAAHQKIATAYPDADVDWRELVSGPASMKPQGDSAEPAAEDEPDEEMIPQGANGNGRNAFN